MANSLSSKKRIRQNLKRRIRNRARRSAVNTQIRHFRETALQTTDFAVAEQQFRLAQKKLDKMAAAGVMHKNTVARRKSRLARQLTAARARIV